MIISASALAVIIYGALGLTMLAPVVLVALWLRDRRRNQLW